MAVAVTKAAAVTVAAKVAEVVMVVAVAAPVEVAETALAVPGLVVVEVMAVMVAAMDQEASAWVVEVGWALATQAVGPASPGPGKKLRWPTPWPHQPASAMCGILMNGAAEIVTHPQATSEPLVALSQSRPAAASSRTLSSGSCCSRP